MINLTNTAVADITNCDQEPIHIPGTIQPHGYLLALEVGTTFVTHCSANTDDLLKLPLADILGKPIFHLFPDLEEELGSYLTQTSTFKGKKLTTTLHSQPYDLTVHKGAERYVLEFEVVREEPDAKGSSTLTEVLSLLTSPGNLRQLCQGMAEHIRHLLTYDRVMVYRFDPEDYSGEVLAESVHSDLEPYLDLRYPASDIPPQARDLYLKNPYRSINDTHYEPVALYTLPTPAGHGEQLDLSHAYLRSVSPIHIQYLKNMGVGASLSVSIVKNGHLWGLIACHHGSARYLSAQQRDQVQLLGLLLSSQIQLYESADSLSEVQQTEQKLNVLLSYLEEETTLAFNELIKQPELLDIASSAGVAIVTDDQIFTNGSVPSPGEIKDLALSLSEYTGYESLAVKNLSAIYPPASDFPDTAAGIIYQPLGHLVHDCLLWFRPGIEQTITWAGKPKNSEGSETSVQQQLTPRSSFSAWTETVRNVAAGWSPVHLSTTENFSALFRKQLRLHHVKQEAEKQKALNERLLAVNQELENINWISTHDLREPLRKIQVLASRVLSNDAKWLTSSLIDSINRMHASALRMQKLLDDISAYSSFTAQKDKHSRFELDELIVQTLQELRSAIESHKATITRDPLPAITGLRPQLKELFINLVDNALKFGKPESDVSINITTTSPSLEATEQFSIRAQEYFAVVIQDNGVGFERQYREIIFKIFKRLDNETKGTKGTGVGLAICRKVMSNHGGYIWVDSHPNEGSRFELIFPNTLLAQ